MILFSSPRHWRGGKSAGIYLIALISLLSCHWAIAQQSGSLVVSVNSTEDRRAETGVELRLTSRGGDVSTAVSGDDGKARWPELAPGLYSLTATKAGFLPVTEPALRVRAGKVSEASLSLVLSQREEQLLVVAVQRGVSDDFASVSASSLDREALRSAPGSGADALRALDGLPGLVSTGGFASFTVRGRGPQDNLILVDDIPFDNVVHFNQSVGEQEELGGGRYSVFAPNLISEAEFQPGGWSSDYAGRSGSLLNLNVAAGNRESPSFKVRIDVAGPELTYDGPSYVHDDTSVLFSVRKLNFGRVFDMIGANDIGTPELTDVIFKSSTAVNENNNINFLAIIAPEKYTRDINNVLVENDDGELDDVSLVTSEQDNTLLAGTWEHFFNGTTQITNRLYYRNTDKTTVAGEAYPDLAPQPPTPENVPVRAGLFTQLEKEVELGLRTDVNMLNALGEMKTGLRLTRYQTDYASTLTENWIRYVYDQQDFRPDPNQKYIELQPGFINNNVSEDSDVYALFADQVFDLGAGNIRVGARYDYDGFTSENLISPRLGATWFATSGLTINATAGVFYQSPRNLDRASSAVNADLGNEQTNQISLGFSQQLAAEWNLLGEFYYQQLDKLVTPKDRVTGIATNTGTGKSHGIDLVLNKYFSDRWSANVSYSYNQAKVDYNDGIGELDTDFQRPHAMSVAGVWEINARWKISSRLKFLSGRPDDAYLVHTNVLGDDQPLRYSKEITEQNVSRFDNYSSLNFRVDYERTFGPTTLIAFLDVINALGAENTNESRFNERTGLHANSSGKPFPLFGLSLEF